MDILAVMQKEEILFLLIFARVSGVFSTAPVLGSRNIPTIAKAGMALLFSYILFPPVTQKQEIAVPTMFLAYIAVVIGEFLIGLIIGFASSLVFSAVQMAGQILDMQVGFSTANLLDPQFDQQISLFGNFYYLLALVIFLAINGHHLLISALFSSFDVVPLLNANFWRPQLMEQITQLITAIFIMAIKISLPALVALFLTDVAMGVLARTMPQMNIFMVGMPGKILVGVFLIFLSLPFYVIFLEVGFHGMYRELYRLLLALQ